MSEISSKAVIDHLVTSDVRRLNHIRRYSSYPIIRQENVAEHLFWVTYSSYLIALDIKNYTAGITVDMDALMEKAMLHDLEESQTGDVVRTFKYHSPETRTLMNQTAIGLISKFLTDTLPKQVAEHVISRLKVSKDESLEGQIVALADLLAVLTYGREELLLGNSKMRGILIKSLDYLREFRRNIKHQCLIPYVDEIIRCVLTTVSSSKET